MFLLLVAIVIISYFLMQLIEMASLGSRVAGKISESLALGTTLQLSIYTASRFLLIPFLPVLGYLVESGMDVEHYLVLVIISLFSTFMASIFVLYKLNSFQLFFQKVFNRYSVNNIPTALVKSFFSTSNPHISFIACASFSLQDVAFNKLFISFIAYFFLITGFFIAFLLAIIFPEYRLTLSQFTAVFHGIGAIIIAFYLDPMLSRSLDRHSDKNIWLNNVYSILFGRVLSYFVAFILFILVLFIGPKSILI